MGVLIRCVRVLDSFTRALPASFLFRSPESRLWSSTVCWTIPAKPLTVCVRAKVPPSSLAPLVAPLLVVPPVVVVEVVVVVVVVLETAVALLPQAALAAAAVKDDCTS